MSVPATTELVVVAVGDLDRRAIAGLHAAARFDRADVMAIHVAGSPNAGRDYALRWLEAGLDPIPLHVVERQDGQVDIAVLAFVIDQVEAGYEQIHVLVPQLVKRSRFERWLHDDTAAGIAQLLAARPMVDVALVPYDGASPEKAGAGRRPAQRTGR